MINHLLTLFALCLLFSCKKLPDLKLTHLTDEKVTDTIKPPQPEIEHHVPSIDSIALGINFTPKGNYTEMLNRINQDRSSLKKSYQTNPDKTLDSISNYFNYTMLNTIIPHWYGTTWDFNGHTNIPNQGEIACGYFVSTTLKHFGFNLNRYKLAQQGGTNEALSLQPNKKLSSYRNIEYHNLKSKLLNSFKDGIYFVGLSNHVGYLLIKNNELYFIHSSYCDNKVVIELAEHSACFASDIYVFAELSTNKDLLIKWLSNQSISIKQ